MSPVAIGSADLRSILGYVGAISLSILFLIYLLFQARLLLSGPTVTLREELAVVQNERMISLTGKADNITSISVNGRSIVTDQAGYFQEYVILENGYTVVSITAHDRYGRSTTLTREFVYSPRSLLPS